MLRVLTVLVSLSALPFLVLGVSVIAVGRGGLGWGWCVCMGLEGEGGMSGYTLYMMSMTEYLFVCGFQ